MLVRFTPCSEEEDSEEKEEDKEDEREEHKDKDKNKVAKKKKKDIGEGDVTRRKFLSVQVVCLDIGAEKFSFSRREEKRSPYVASLSEVENFPASRVCLVLIRTRGRGRGWTEADVD